MDLQIFASKHQVKLSVCKAHAAQHDLDFDNLSDQDEKVLLAALKNNPSNRPQLTASEASELVKQGKLNIEHQTQDVNIEALNLESARTDLIQSAIAQGKSEAQAFLEVRNEAFYQQIEASISDPMQVLVNSAIESTLTAKAIKSKASEIVAPAIRKTAIASKEDVVKSGGSNTWEALLKEKNSVWDDLIND